MTERQKKERVLELMRLGPKHEEIAFYLDESKKEPLGPASQGGPGLPLFYVRERRFAAGLWPTTTPNQGRDPVAVRGRTHGAAADVSGILRSATY